MTPEQLALSEAIALAGGQSELARKLTASSGHLVKQQHVWNWLNRESVPLQSSRYSLKRPLAYQKKNYVQIFFKRLKIHQMKSNHSFKEIAGVSITGK
ncbi:helix-turn-helix domain-containing protein [Escherichia coli]|uniref:helix-turn-helix domain-containing protein n=1 Tax=Escherichia coli TaxID=562 RepID=UPI001EE25835|nr:helix-turn-helix domain-containing protein [Escherichia coli]